MMDFIVITAAHAVDLPMVLRLALQYLTGGGNAPAGSFTDTSSIMTCDNAYRRP
jgi:hypothetical protein